MPARGKRNHRQGGEAKVVEEALTFSDGAQIAFSSIILAEMILIQAHFR
ncbi:MAG: hypothetical protein RML36_07865 [Anaerolineae bacterium]|nr:hypothetical protein [Anaerolineae bacterium]MDW8099379.1 hypothetical protein [Anaerolineae bacterium]